MGDTARGRPTRATRSAQAALVSKRALEALRELYTKHVATRVAQTGAIYRRIQRPFALSLLTALSIFILLPSSFYFPFRGGMDPHWQLGVYVAYHNGQVFGRDVVFTYGPLGFLEGRPEVRGVKHALMIWDALFYGAAAVVLYRIYNRLTGGLERTTAFLCVLGLGIVSGVKGTQLLFPLELYFLYAHVNERTRRALWLAAAAVVAIVDLYVKVSVGIVGLVLLFAYSGYRIILERPWRRAALELAGALGALVLSFFVLRVAPWGYVRSGVEFIRGYAGAMGSYDPHQAHLLPPALFLLAVFFSSLLADARRLSARRSELVQVLVALAALLMFFQQSFVRLDAPHVVQFFQMGMLGTGFLYVQAGGDLKKTLRPYVAFAAGASVSLVFDSLAFDDLAARYRAIFGYLRVASSPTDTAPLVAPALARHAGLPPSFLREIDKASVDVFPHAAALAWRYQLNYAPRPILQGYAGFTPYLDGLDATFFESPRAPRFVIYSHEALSVPSYSPCWSEPRTRLSLFAHYQVADADRDQLLLERREHPRVLDERHRWSGRGRIGQSVRVPSVQGLVVFAANVRPSWTGSLLGLTYRRAPLRVEIKLDRGPVSTPVVPAHLADGLMVSPYVGNASDAKAFFAGHSSQIARPSEVRVLTDDAGQYSDAFDFEFRELGVTDDGDQQ